MKTETRKRTWGALAAVGTLLAVAGCAAGPAAGGAEGTVKFGVVTAVGSGGSNYPDIEGGAKAAVEAINKDGGINGKNVEMVFCNTRGEANQAMACAREMDEKGVVATVGRIDIFAPQSFPILEAAGIPDIGTVSTGAEIDFQSPMSFPLHGGNFGAYTSLPHAFKADGDKSMVVASIDLPIGITQGQYAEKVGKGIGLDVKPMIKIPSQGVTDYSPYVQQIADSGADSAIVALGPAPFQAFVKAADGLGLKARIAGTAFTFGQSEAAGVGELANNMLVSAPFPSVDDRGNPGIAEYHRQLDEAGVEDSESMRRFAGLNAWLAMHAAAKVARTIEGEITRESMVKALRGTTDLDLFGLITYSPATLDTDLAKNAFARFPKEPYHALTFKSPTMVDAGLGVIEDPLELVR